jgi:hypothetical protein
MKYAIEVDSGAMVYTLNFIKVGSGIQKLIGGGIQRHADRMEITNYSGK